MYVAFSNGKVLIRFEPETSASWQYGIAAFKNILNNRNVPTEKFLGLTRSVRFTGVRSGSGGVIEHNTDWTFICKLCYTDSNATYKECHLLVSYLFYGPFNQQPNLCQYVNVTTLVEGNTTTIATYNPPTTAIMPATGNTISFTWGFADDGNGKLLATAKIRVNGVDHVCFPNAPIDVTGYDTDYYPQLAVMQSEGEHHAWEGNDGPNILVEELL